MTAHSYIAYGLGIRSYLPLPELVESNAPQDVIVSAGRVEDPVNPTVITNRLWLTRAGIYLRHEPGTMLVRNGCEIIVDASPDAEERALRQSILGPAMGVLLHQRGLLALHGSSVSINGGAVAFLGASGWGKSTMAAAFHRRGCRVLSDDVISVAADQHHPIVYPAYPQLKIAPDTAISTGDDPETLVPLPGTGKHARPVKRGFSIEPLPVRRIYVLGESSTPEISTLASQEAVIELVRHSYCVVLLPAIGAVSHLQQCGNVARHVPVRRLNRPRNLALLSDLAQMIETDLENGS